jgi:hypothetical protein
LRRYRVRVICDQAIEALRDAPAAEIYEVRSLLAANGHLASVLARLEPEDLGFQSETLTDLLRAVYLVGSPSASLPETARRDILAGDGRHAPTLALLLAVLRLTEPTAVNEVLFHFMTGLASFEGLSEGLREVLANRGWGMAIPRQLEEPAESHQDERRPRPVGRTGSFRRRPSPPA